MYVCIYNIYVNTHIPKYNFFSLYNVACIYVSRADSWALDNHLGCSSLEKTAPPISSFPRLPVVFCVELSFMAFPCMLWHAQQWHPWSAHCWVVTLVRPFGRGLRHAQRRKLPADSLILGLLQSPPLFAMPLQCSRLPWH